MQLLLGIAGVESLFVAGTGQNASGITELHAWNKVKINGEWYNFDVTWNDLVSGGPGEISYAYFALPDDAFSANHQWDRQAYPQSAPDTAFNYYYYNNLVAKDYSQFRAIITQELLKRKNDNDITVSLYVENFDPNVYLLNFIYNILPNIKKAAYSKPDGASGELILKISQEGTNR
jgi:transglutaminase/protease-like cytokinesis protein 3